MPRMDIDTQVMDVLTSVDNDTMMSYRQARLNLEGLKYEAEMERAYDFVNRIKAILKQQPKDIIEYSIYPQYFNTLQAEWRVHMHYIQNTYRLIYINANLPDLEKKASMYLWDGYDIINKNEYDRIFALPADTLDEKITKFRDYEAFIYRFTGIDEEEVSLTEEEDYEREGYQANDQIYVGLTASLKTQAPSPYVPSPLLPKSRMPRVKSPSKYELLYE